MSNKHRDKILSDTIHSSRNTKEYQEQDISHTILLKEELEMKLQKEYSEVKMIAKVLSENLKYVLKKEMIASKMVVVKGDNFVWHMNVCSLFRSQDTYV